MTNYDDARAEAEFAFGFAILTCVVAMVYLLFHLAHRFGGASERWGFQFRSEIFAELLELIPLIVLGLLFALLVLLLSVISQ